MLRLPDGAHDDGVLVGCRLGLVLYEGLFCDGLEVGDEAFKHRMNHLCLLVVVEDDALVGGCCAGDGEASVHGRGDNLQLIGSSGQGKEHEKQSYEGFGFHCDMCLCCPSRVLPCKDKQSCT